MKTRHRKNEMASLIEEKLVSRELPYKAVGEDQWRIAEPRQEKGVKHIRTKATTEPRFHTENAKQIKLHQLPKSPPIDDRSS